MKKVKMAPDVAERIKDEWLNAVRALKQQVSVWAEQEGWAVTESPQEIIEDDLGTYTAPVLEVDAREGQLILRPIARLVMGAAGRVDLSVWPSLYRVMLLRRPGPDLVRNIGPDVDIEALLEALKNSDWVVRTESGIDWPHPWGKETFVDLSKRLLRVA